MGVWAGERVLGGGTTDRGAVTSESEKETDEFRRKGGPGEVRVDVTHWTPVIPGLQGPLWNPSRQVGRGWVSGWGRPRPTY